MHSITFQPAETDLANAHRLNYMVALKTGKFFRVLLIGAVVIAAIAALIVWYFELNPIWKIAGGFALYWILLLTVVAGASYLSIPRQARRIFAQQKGLHDKTRVEWDDNGLAIHSSRSQSNFVWDDFIAIAADDKMLILKQSDSLMNFIPMRALSAEQVREILAHAPVKA